MFRGFKNLQFIILQIRFDIENFLLCGLTIAFKFQLQDKITYTMQGSAKDVATFFLNSQTGEISLKAPLTAANTPNQFSVSFSGQHVSLSSDLKYRFYFIFY